MKSIKEILTSIGETLRGYNFEDVKDQSGNLIRIDKYEVGSKVQLISTDGTLIDVPDGDYTLEDGRSFTVAGNVIASIVQDVKNPDQTTETVQPIANAVDKPTDPATTPASGTVVPETDPATTDKVTPDVKKIQDDLTTIQSDMEEMKTAIAELSTYIEQMVSMTSEFKDIKKKMNKEKSELEKEVNDLKKTPAGDPIQIQASKLKDKEPKSDLIDFGAFKIHDIDYAEAYRNMQQFKKDTKNSK